jgi:hypothetical protein
MLDGRLANADDGALGFDTNTPVSRAKAQKFHSDGFRFCLRYLSFLEGQDKDKDLSTGEANDILDAGLALMPVQHVRKAGWPATGALGTAFGRTAVDNARDVGFRPGVTVWMDLEGVSPKSSPADVMAYCYKWFEQVHNAGYLPGLYVGASPGLNSSQLGHDLPFQHYWRSGSDVPQVDGRGYQIIQSHLDEVVHGIKIDRDRTQADQRGGRAFCLIRA